MLLVDESPLLLGHCLALTHSHVTSSGRLDSEAFREFRKFLESCEALIRDACDSGTCLVEHGAGDEQATWDCVRHAHVHVVPCDRNRVASQVAAVFPSFVTDIREIPRDDEAVVRGVLREYGEYLTLGVGKHLWIGTPKPGIPHGSRALIVRLCDLSSDLIDWSLWARGLLFRQSVRTLVRNQRQL